MSPHASARIEFLNVDITVKMLPRLFPADGNHVRVNLQFLQLRCLRDESGFEGIVLNILATDAPRLTNIEFDGITLQHLALLDS